MVSRRRVKEDNKQVRKEGEEERIKRRMRKEMRTETEGEKKKKQSRTKQRDTQTKTRQREKSIIMQAFLHTPRLALAHPILDFQTLLFTRKFGRYQ